jgi:hypothetical protein
MRRASGLFLIAAFVSGLSAVASSQSSPLRVLNAGPQGEIRQLTDANEIRVVFSEPMVPLGRIPSNPTPDWIRITPAIPGVVRWSGTTILIFTPDPSRPLPHATPYMVQIAATATAVSGRQLGQSFSFTFTTPTVRLESARWARLKNRFDQPVTLALQFNQRVDPNELLRHLTVRFQPHEWRPPTLTERERTWLGATAPTAIQRFESATLIVLETTTAPPPGTWLQLTLGTGMPSPEGPARPQPRRRRRWSYRSCF